MLKLDRCSADDMCLSVEWMHRLSDPEAVVLARYANECARRSMKAHLLRHANAAAKEAGTALVAPQPAPRVVTGKGSKIVALTSTQRRTAFNWQLQNTPWGVELERCLRTMTLSTPTPGSVELHTLGTYCRASKYDP